MPWSSSRPRSDAYGYEHAQARKRWAAQHDPADPCTRCGHPLGVMGRWLHLDHSADRSTYLGFAHGRCNVVAGAKEGRRRQGPAGSTRLRW